MGKTKDKSNRAAKKEEIIKMYQNHIPCVDIAKKVNESCDYIIRVVREAGVEVTLSNENAFWKATPRKLKIKKSELKGYVDITEMIDAK